MTASGQASPWQAGPGDRGRPQQTEGLTSTQERGVSPQTRPRPPDVGPGADGDRVVPGSQPLQHPDLRPRAPYGCGLGAKGQGLSLRSLSPAGGEAVCGDA